MEKKERSLYNVLYSLYNIKYMKIPELIDLINEFVFGKDLATEEKLKDLLPPYIVNAILFVTKN